MNQKVSELREKFETELQSVKDVTELENMRVAYLGKKGSITAVLKDMGKLSDEERKALGQEVNVLKNEVTDKIADKKEEFARLELEKEINSILDYNATIKSRKSDIKSTIELLEKIIQEGEISDANIRMLVNKIVVSEQNGMISIQIKLNAKFTNHIMTYDEDNTNGTNMLSSGGTVKMDTPCGKQSVSFNYKVSSK